MGNSRLRLQQGLAETQNIEYRGRILGGMSEIVMLTRAFWLPVSCFIFLQVW